MKSLKRLLNKAISPLSEKNKRDIVVQARLLIEIFSIELVLVLEVSCGGLFGHSLFANCLFSMVLMSPLRGFTKR
jgi:hypothetical protein